MNKQDLIYIPGGTGMVGSAIIRSLQRHGYNNLVSSYHKRKPEKSDLRWVDLDLLDQLQVAEFFQAESPDHVFLAAAKVGGIFANHNYRADFIYQNLQIQNNIIQSSYKNGVKKLLFLGSSCIYPKECPQPMQEEHLLTGPLEYTNEPYAIAKIAGMKMCESYNLQHGTNFISVMPTNLYGPRDNFDLETSHVLPALIRKVHLAKLASENNLQAINRDERIFGPIPADLKKSLGISPIGPQALAKSIDKEPEVIIWGSGTPMREFMYSDDMADACVYLMQNVDFRDVVQNRNKGDSGESDDIVRNCHINVGTGKEISIKELAEMVKEVVGFRGKLVFDTSMPDGTPRKLLDVSRLRELGFREKVDLGNGIEKLYRWYTEQ